jgi:hypothetical protein
MFKSFLALEILVYSGEIALVVPDANSTSIYASYGDAKSILFG